MMKMSLILVLLCFLTLPVQPAFGASTSPIVIVAPASDNVYAVQGVNFSGITRVDITLHYNTAAVAAPRVAQGSLASGALMALNASEQGVVRFSLIRTGALNGSGTLATVRFAQTTSTDAGILSVEASALLSGADKLRRIESQVQIPPKTADNGAPEEQRTGTGSQKTPDNGAPTERQTGLTNTESGPSTGRTARNTTTVPPPSNAPSTMTPVQWAGAAMAGPSENPSSQDDVQAETPSSNNSDPDVQKENKDAAVFPEMAKAAPDENLLRNKAVPERKRTIMYKSVLERFKEFKGQKTPQSLIDLFASGIGEGRQDPPLALSDGKTTVKIVLELHSGEEDNHFVLDGASLVSLTHKGGNHWIAELLPDKNALEATVSVPRNDQWQVTPLTVSPFTEVAIGSSGKPAEADFKLYLYLSERGTAKAPRFDLNGDGRCDYIDDYIFTANYLARQQVVRKNTMRASQ